MNDIFERRVTNVFPGSVQTEGWSQSHHALTQDVDGDAIFGAFNITNSATLEPMTHMSVSPMEMVSDDGGIVPVESPVDVGSTSSVQTEVISIESQPEYTVDASESVSTSSSSESEVQAVESLYASPLDFESQESIFNFNHLDPVSELMLSPVSLPDVVLPEVITEPHQESESDSLEQPEAMRSIPLHDALLQYVSSMSTHHLAQADVQPPAVEDVSVPVASEVITPDVEIELTDTPETASEPIREIVSESSSAQDLDVVSAPEDAAMDQTNIDAQDVSVPEIVDVTTQEGGNSMSPNTFTDTEELQDDTTVLSPDEKNMLLCDEAKCFQHVLEFSDFSVGDNFDDQYIANMQLRISLGATPHANNNPEDERILVEYLHYDEWINGGVIVINDEVSNAMNGGHQLFAFPLYSDWDELKRIKVRLTYASNNEEFATVYVDSVWLEIESMHNDALNDPLSMPQNLKPAKLSDELRTLPPEGYVTAFENSKTEFAYNETPAFTFRIDRTPETESFFDRITRRIQTFLGIDHEDTVSSPIVRVVSEEFLGIAEVREVEGVYHIDIPKRRAFTPGTHILTLEVQDGDTVFYIDQEFSWGVLAVNFDKTIYHEDEKGYVQMGVLDEKGHTICDASLELTVTDPMGIVQYLSTDAGTISYGEECAGDTFTTSPDYDAHYIFRGGVGVYEIVLTANTRNGVSSISDRIEVRESVPFEIVRTGPTRIFPPALYPVTLSITASESYVGTVVEQVPATFQVFPVPGSPSFTTHEVGDIKQLIWENISLDAGERLKLEYTFDAPDISPEFYLLGPLQLDGFAEIREWQIASDAPDAAVVVQTALSTPASATSYSATFATPPTTGNTIIMVATHRDGASAFNAPAFLSQAVLSNAAVEADIGIWYGIADAATSSYSISKTGGNQTGVVMLMEVSGLDTTTLLNATSSNDQTGANGLVAYTGATPTTTQYAFSVAASIFGDDDFTAPTSNDWVSDSSNTYTQRGTVDWTLGNDGEFAAATANVTTADSQGATLTLTVGGTEQRNSVIAVFKVQQQQTVVGSRGNQVSQLKINTANNYVGGMFTLIPNTGYATVTSITVSEAGTTDASTDLSNIRLYYEHDTVAPFDCASSTYDGNEVQYGATSSAFSSANGTSTFSANVAVATTSVMCVFPVLNVDASATLGHTVELQITTPNTQVVMDAGSTTPGTAVAISDTSTIVVGFAPATPTLVDTPAFPYMRSTTTQPTFGGFVSTDADGDAIEYEFSIDDDPSFGSPATTTYSSNFPNDAGWASTTFVGGATTTYRIQQALTPGTTYWWRVRARDPFNANTWSAYSVIRSVTISNAITVPEWFQTTAYQFATSGTLTNATTSTGDVTIENQTTAITQLDAWTSGTTKSISAGSNRVLIVAIANEDTGTDAISTVTYGGQTLTEIYDQTVGGGASNSLWVGYLNEAGIATSTNTTITPNWTPGAPAAGNILVYSAVYEDVNQINPVRGFSSNALTTGTTITPSASTTALAGDMSFYVVGRGAARTDTPHTGYTEALDTNASSGGSSASVAYKSISTDRTELPTATLSASTNRVLITEVVLAATPAEGVIMSPPIDFDWVTNQTDWGEVDWTVTEDGGSNTRLRLYYGTSTPCSTLVPDSALAGNALGFATTSRPLNISSLSTTTYNNICLQMTLSEGFGSTTPQLQDWSVSWELTPVYEQIAYRWYANSSSSTPTDAWPPTATSEELGENTPMSSTQPIAYDEVIRLRMGIEVSSVTASSDSFKLQYASGSVCSVDMDWVDVGAIGSTTALWRGYDNSGIADGLTLSSTTLTSSDTFETYEEENNSATMPNSVSVGNQGEWDWVVQHRADEGASYCFRMVKPDGSPLNTYTVYPQLITNEASEIIDLYSPFDNQKVASTSPWFEFSALDAELDSVDYQIQIDNDADFGSTIVDTNSITNLDDFQNLDTPSDKSPFIESERIRYTIPSALTNGVTYWWRVRSIDTEGSNTYGAWADAQSITVDTSVTLTTWYQTTEEQFDTNTLVNMDTTGSDTLILATGSTTGTTTSSIIDFDDVVTGNSWGVLSWNDTETSGDILYHIEYFDGADWVLVPDSSLAANNAGFDTSPVDLIDLDTEVFNELRIRANFTNSGGSPILSDWTVTWGERVSVVTHLLLFDNEKTGTTTPTFNFYTTDPQGESLEYELSWSTDNTFTTGSTTVNSSTSPGFSNITSGGGDTNPFNSGDTIQYVMQTPLTNNTTYWWRVRAKDPSGGDSFSFWSNPWSFTVDTLATTSTWFQTTQEQFETDTLLSLEASTSDAVSTVAAGVSIYNFSGITNPSATHIARDFEVDVNDPTDPPTVDEIDSLTNNGTAAGTPLLRGGILGYASDAEATSGQYTQLSVSDNSRWQITDPGAGDNAVFWASFVINEDAADIAQIEVNLEGYQAAAVDKAWLGIWRPGSTTPYWQHLDDSQQTGDFLYTGAITSNISQYLDGNNRIHIIFFNEDDSDSLFVDYVEVEVTSDSADSGTLTSSPIDFNDGVGPAWGALSWTDTEPGLSTLTYHVQYLTSGGAWTLIPDSALSGNAAGFSTSPINLKFLDTDIYSEIRLIADFSCVIVNCPTLQDWTVTWSPGFTVSGTAFEYDGVSSTTAGTVAVAVNGVLQTGKTGTISNGSWTIPNVTYFEGDTVTVFVQGAADADEAVAVTTFDGVPDMSGLRLQKRHLTIGSDDLSTATSSQLGMYDFSDTEDIFFDVDGGNDLTMCVTSGCGDAGLVILSGSTFSPGAGAQVTTHDFVTQGTFIAGSNTHRVSGSWRNTGTTTMTGSIVILTASTTSEVIVGADDALNAMNTLTLGETSGTATWTVGDGLDIDGNFTVAFGTFARGTTSLTIAGNVTTGGSGFWTGIASTTFDGINPSTWTDSNATKQNIGRVTVDGTSKTLLLGSNVTMQSLYIGTNDTFDLGAAGYTASVYRDWINTNTFTPRTGTVEFIATTTNFIVTAGGDAFYNLRFNGASGSWSFTEADLTVQNDLTIATGTVTLPTGTTTIQGSFNAAGGTFAHNNALVQFTSSGAETIVASSTAFTNHFYDLRFSGSGSWSFVDTAATTSHDMLVTQGTVTLPSGTISLGGSLAQSGGTINANSGVIRFTSTGAETIDLSGSSLAHIHFAGTGTWTFVDSTATLLGDYRTFGGTAVLPSGTLFVGGSWQNQATTTPNGGTVVFNSTDSGETISPGASSFYDLEFRSSTGEWTISESATSTHNVMIASSTSFVVGSGLTLSVGGTFTNRVGGASTTWTGSTLSLESGSYTLNTKSLGADTYDTLRVRSAASIAMWNSSAMSYVVEGAGSLYSQDHSAVDGSLYIFGNYTRTSGTEYWHRMIDFDGVVLSTSTARAVDVRISDTATLTIAGDGFAIMGTTTATTTVRNQGTGSYVIENGSASSTFAHYAFEDLGMTGVSFSGTGTVHTLNDGRVIPSITTGTGFTISSTTIDANPGLQIYRVDFSTTTAIAASNVTQSDGNPASYWWFRNSRGNIDGEAFDADTGDPGSIRWDDSSLVIMVEGVVYSDDGVTPMTGPVCDDVTPVVRIVVEGGAAHTGSCASADGSFSIPGVVIVGDPVVVAYLNTNGGPYGAVVTRTPTTNITDLDIYARRVTTRHEDVAPLTLNDMMFFDYDDDTDVRFTAATNTLTLFAETELHIASSTTFIADGDITIHGNASSSDADGSLHIAPFGVFTGMATSTYTLGGSLILDTGAVFVPASSSVVMNATTTGKTITADTGTTVMFNELAFTGVGGGWHLNADIQSVESIFVATGTVTGTGDITLVYGALYGNGLVSLGAGTTTFNQTNTFGGTTPWTFANLVLGNSVTNGTTTHATGATTTVSGALTIAAGHTYAAGGSRINLAGSGTVFVENGTFAEATSTVRYSGTGATSLRGTTYYNLEAIALLGSPTYTALGSGVQVLNQFTIGGPTTTIVTFTTNDPVLEVDGTLMIGGFGTLIASDVSTTTIGGNWINDGAFTSSNGTVLFDASGSASIAAGASSFARVHVNGSGTFTFTESATATQLFTLTSAGSFGMASSSVLAVGGTFTNNVGGVATQWADTTLYLYGGGNYSINATSTSDTYGALSVAAGTHIRMWNASASVYDTAPLASLYSQDHNGVDGDLYIFGDYLRASGTDYWSYATDFDGTNLTATPRVASVHIEGGGTVTYAGGGLAVLGTSTASSTVQNQGSGSYGIRIGGTSSTTWSYYVLRNTDVSGLVFSGAPTVHTLAFGDYEVSQNSGTALTVGGTVINQNPAKTFTSVRFGTSTGISAPVNVTATGTAISSWRFTNHTGSIAGEAYDSDPAGDPGYLVWDDSAALITIAGTVYQSDGVATSTVCDGSTQNIVLRVAGLTTYQTSCNASTGGYSIPNVSYGPEDSFVVYINDESENGTTVSTDPISSIGNFDIYENHVIVRHENSDPLSILDMSAWDSDNDPDILFTATDAAPDTLVLPADTELMVWTNKTFEPNGNVTVSGGGGGAQYDGSLTLLTNAVFDATGSETHILGGHMVFETGASLEPAQSTVIFTTSAVGRTVDTNNGSLYNAQFTGSGSWTITDTTVSMLNDLSITQGTVTLPTATTTIVGSLNVTGGSFIENGGIARFTPSASETLRTGSSPLGTLVIDGTGSVSVVGTNATVTRDVYIRAGTFAGATGTLVIGNHFINEATFTHNSGILRFIASSSTVVTASSSDLHSTTFAGGGTYTFTDTNVALLGTLRIENGTATLATGTMSIGGSLINTGGSFTHSSGTILFNSSDTGEVVTPGLSVFSSVVFASASGGWTITGDATTTRNFSLTSANSFTLASGARLAVLGLFTNTVGGGATTWTGSTLDIQSGTSYTINTKSTGGDTYNIVRVGSSTALRAWDSAGTFTVTDAVSSVYSQDHAGVSGALSVYGNYVRTTGFDYWSYATDFDGTALGGSSRAVTVSHENGATTTLRGGTLAIVGANGFDTVITNQGSGTFGLRIEEGTLNAQYFSLLNMNAAGLVLLGTSTISSLSEGNFTLAVNGGSLITVSSTTLNYNAGLVVTAASFSTTTAITGTNVALIGSTPSTWSFIGHSGNFDGEAFDSDGGDDCGSVRWDDSTCLLTQQSAYRWRADDGGEGVPNSEWYDLSWTKRKRVSVTNYDAVSYTNATVKLDVPYDSDMQADFDDLRFTDDTGTVLVSHFTERYTASTEAVVWVEVPLLATSTITNVYMYYGNGAVADASATSTFVFAETFEDDNLTEYAGDTGDFSVVGSAAYERTYRLEAFDQNNSKTDQSMNNTGVTVSQGQTLRWFQYIDTTTGSSDETCTHFGVQTSVTSYAVCLELFGTDRISISENAIHRDTSGTVLASTTVSYTTGWYEVEVDWGTDDTIFASLYKDEVLVATTSATDASYSSGGVGFTLWGYHGGWDMYTSRILITTTPTTTFGYEQVSGGASWLNDVNTAGTGISTNEKARVRFLVENTGLPITNQNFELEFAAKGASPSCEAVAFGSFVEVPNVASCGTSAICMETSSHITNLDATTDLLGGEGLFTPGQIVEDPSNNTGSLDVDGGEYTELEYVLMPTTNTSDSSYCFRVSNEGTDLDAYTRVAELTLLFEPSVTAVSLNSGVDITLTGGSTTTVTATGTVSDLNGFADLAGASTTIFRSGVGESCSLDTNNCYVAGNSACSFVNCSGTSCDVECSVDMYYHADPTDIGTFAAETWRALLAVQDFGGAVATATAPSIDLLTLRAISVDSSINYGSLAPTEDTGSYNATTTVNNIGNDSLDISIAGSDLSDGSSSVIPVSEQIFATSTFTYSACTLCSSLATTSTNLRLDLTKPASTTPAVFDEVFWGISIPFGVAGTAHEGANTFYAIGDLP